MEDSEEGEEEFVYEDQDQEESGNEEPDEIYEASEEHGFVEEPTFPEDAFAQAMVKERGQWRKRWEAGHKAKPHRQQGNRRDAASAQKAAQGHGAVRRATREEQGVKGEAGINGKGASDQPRAIPVALVVMMTIVMAFAAGLGALPFFFVGSLSRHWSGLATAVACGVMFAASFDLIHEGQPYGGNLVILGIFLGGFFISAMQKWLDGMEDVKVINF